MKGACPITESERESAWDWLRKITPFVDSPYSSQAGRP